MWGKWLGAEGRVGQKTKMLVENISWGREKELSVKVYSIISIL